MGEVIEVIFNAMAGTARCLHCEHEWTAVVHQGTYSGLECPKCHLGRGVMKYNASADEVIECACGCDIYKLSATDPGHAICVKCGCHYRLGDPVDDCEDESNA